MRAGRLAPTHPMSYQFSHEQDQSLLCVVYEGELELEELFRSRSESVERMNAKGLRRVLVDMRDSVDRLSTADRYDFVASHGDVLAPGARLAVLASERNVVPVNQAFVENVARNRGVELRFFADEREARAWLLAA